MDANLSRFTRSIVWLPSDPLVSDRNIKSKLFSSIVSTLENAEEIFLPNPAISQRVPYDLYVPDKVSPDLVMWDLHRKHAFTWQSTTFPVPVVMAAILLFDTVKWWHVKARRSGTLSTEEIQDSIASLTKSQAVFVRSQFNMIRSFSDLPLLLVYVQEWPDSLPIEKLIDQNTLKNVNYLVYRVADHARFPAELRALLG
jgi:hypothetical protein